MNGSPDFHWGIDLRVGEPAYWTTPVVCTVLPVSKKPPCTSAAQVFADILEIVASSFAEKLQTHQEVQTNIFKWLMFTITRESELVVVHIKIESDLFSDYY